VLFEKENLKT